MKNRKYFTNEVSSQALKLMGDFFQIWGADIPTAKLKALLNMSCLEAHPSFFLDCLGVRKVKFDAYIL